MTSNRTTLFVVVGVLAVLACVAFVCLGSAGLAGYALYRSGPTAIVGLFPTDTPSRAPVQTLDPAATPSPELLNMVRALEEALIPERDPVEIARRLNGVTAIPTPPGQAAPRSLGDREDFYVTDTDTNETRTVEAVLRGIRPHVYFWVEQGVQYDEDALEATLDRFENEIYPTTREFFGSEFSPGIDGDEHLYILFARGLGFSTAGYFSSEDSYPAVVHEYSNEHEMFYISADGQSIGDAFVDSVLAHEFQHMVHWNLDRNEESWVNEGFAEVSSDLSGYGPSNLRYSFLSDPDLQLNTWPGPDGDTLPHYGAGFMFLSYFLQRFGDEATQALVAHPANGFTGVDAVLDELGQSTTADDVFVDWTVANLLADPDVDSGRYRSYSGMETHDTVQPNTRVDECPAPVSAAEVHQYGADYIRIACHGAITVNFSGQSEVRVVPTDFPGGEFAFWSNRADESDMTLTREFDFSSASGPLMLEYRLWHEIEPDYDYVYLEVSTDGGMSWTILETPSGTAEDPTGANLRWGYNGNSGGGNVPEWVEEQVDLSEYAGEPDVLLRFEYVTDAAVNLSGLLIDQIAIPAIDYSEDFETGDGGWEAAGFVRLRNALPQTFRVTAVERGPQGTRVTPVVLDAANTGEYSTTLGQGYDELILVVSGTARFTEQLAAYEIRVD